MVQDDDLYTLLARLQLQFGSLEGRFFQKYNLGNRRYYALLHVHNFPGISLSELSRRLLCTKGNTTRIVRSLEADGILRREPDPGDNRAGVLYLTSQGEDLLARVAQDFARLNELRFACLAADKKTALQLALEKLTAHLEALELLV